MKLVVERAEIAVGLALLGSTGVAISLDTCERPASPITPLSDAAFSDLMQPSPVMISVPEYERYVQFGQEEKQREARRLTADLDDLGKKYLELTRLGLSREDLQRRASGIIVRQFILSGTEVRVDSKNEGVSVTIKNREYELGKPTDFVLASTIAQTRLNRFYGNLYYDAAYYIEKDATDQIEWLQDTVTFEAPEVLPIVRPADILTLAKTLRTLLEAGQQIPIRWRIADAMPGYDETAKTAVISNGNRYIGSPATVVAAFYRQEYPDFFPQFTETLNRTYEEITGSGMEIRDSLLVSSGYNQSDESDFIFTIAKYLTDGMGMRRNIQYANERGLEAESRVLQAKFNSMRSFFGFETIVAGKVFKESRYPPGDIAFIDDFYPQEWGIFLKPEPVSNINPNWPYTVHGKTVRVEEGPITVTNMDRYAQAMRMYRVSEGVLIAQERAFVPNIHKTGWIPEEFLSRVKPPQ